MWSGALSRWSDAEFLVLGVGLSLPPLLAPLLLPGERARPLGARWGVRFQVVNAITVLLQSALGAQLFFHRLGMEYHFPVRLQLLGTPVFLYFLTVAYFSTYYVVMLAVLGAAARRFPSAPPLLRRLGRAALCYAVAFGETWFMATPGMREWFRYRDVGFMLAVGSAAYGSLFLCTLPAYERLDDAPPPSLGALALGALWANALALAVYLALALVVTPR